MTARQIIDAEDPKRVFGAFPRPTECHKCGSPLVAGLCQDETCPYSNWAQGVELEDLYELTREQLLKKYGPFGYRFRVGEAEDPKAFLRRVPKGRLLAVFHPQMWQNDYAVEVDPDGPCRWDVTEFLGRMAPEERAKFMEPDTYPSDELRDLPNAPRWAAEWDGPFYIEVVEEQPG